ATHLGINLDHGPQHGHAFVPLAKLHQAVAKIKKRANMRRLARQDLTIVLRGTRELPLIDKRSTKTKERFRMTRHPCQNAWEERLCIHRIAAIETNRT